MGAYAIEVYFLTILEATSPRSRCCQGGFCFSPLRLLPLALWRPFFLLWLLQVCVNAIMSSLTLVRGASLQAWVLKVWFSAWHWWKAMEMLGGGDLMGGIRPTGAVPSSNEGGVGHLPLPCSSLSHVRWVTLLPCTLLLIACNLATGPKGHPDLWT